MQFRVEARMQALWETCEICAGSEGAGEPQSVPPALTSRPGGFAKRRWSLVPGLARERSSAAANHHADTTSPAGMRQGHAWETQDTCFNSFSSQPRPHRPPRYFIVQVTSTRDLEPFENASPGRWCPLPMLPQEKRAQVMQEHRTCKTQPPLHKLRRCN
ncbi:hypothetical protein P154DRAFT_578282 [Amniculicola lignicola CBS 123094]|uniref:Uncharacterized protein n=1 Tax=Amniculicola lignicola CBS 123094 TaxID=1392246 RepID=A0A6A5W8B2_9PLEO|nr:hypothetical protein P154DRAFT_578282 [Amniculicola lignicola CBS 123094]